MRELQLEYIIDKELRKMSIEYIEILEAYTKGINQYATNKTLSLEFWLLGITFKEWTIKDSLMIFKGFSFQLAGNWRQVILREQLKDKLGNTLSELLLPNNSYYDTIEGLKPLLGNSWVIHGNYTKSRKPILSSDLSGVKEIPGEFYFAGIKFMEKEIVGASVPGVPIMLIGSNKNLSWGITGNEINSVYVAEVDNLPVTTKGAIINVKHEKNVAHLLCRTDKGPIISR